VAAGGVDLAGVGMVNLPVFADFLLATSAEMQVPVDDA